MKGIIVRNAKTSMGLAVTTGTIDLLCTAVATGLEYETAAVAVGIKLRQAKRLLKDAIAYAEEDVRAQQFDEPYKVLLEYLVEHLMKAQAEGELALLKNIKGAAEAGDWKAAKALLEIMRPERYSKKAFIYRSPQISATGNKIVDMSEMSDKQLRDIIEGDYQVVSEETQTDEELNNADELSNSTD